jgi:hypothetical protein
MAAHICRLIRDPAAADALAERGFAFATAWNQAQLDVLRHIHRPLENRDAQRNGAACEKEAAIH